MRRRVKVMTFERCQDSAPSFRLIHTKAAARAPAQDNFVAPQEKTWTAPQPATWVAPQQNTWAAPQPIVLDQYGLPQQVEDTPDVQAARAQFFRAFKAAAKAAASASAAAAQKSAQQENYY
ncbi:Uncharacterized protein APZ42_031752 [Daphnia magna]|uniref:Uncharacterized protein n=1 Tax=Daphnia magna TaxID=35525 RepID=A0A164MLP5_9CRUS|nr:Uncharacterized protein APZ42_031752 [Daphnia magna]